MATNYNDLPTLGAELDRAERDNYGRREGNGPGALEMGSVRGEYPKQLNRKVIVEEREGQRHLFFIDPLSHERAERVMTLIPMPPIQYR